MLEYMHTVDRLDLTTMARRLEFSWSVLTARLEFVFVEVHFGYRKISISI